METKICNLVHIYIHIYTYIHIHIYIYIYIYIHTYVYVCPNIHRHRHTHRYIYIYIYIDGKNHIFPNNKLKPTLWWSDVGGPGACRTCGLMRRTATWSVGPACSRRLAWNKGGAGGRMVEVRKWESILAQLRKSPTSKLWRNVPFPKFFCYETWSKVGSEPFKGPDLWAATNWRTIQQSLRSAYLKRHEQAQPKLMGWVPSEFGSLGP